jgi:uncharacterized peroxidase-related enzyme
MTAVRAIASPESFSRLPVPATHEPPGDVRELVDQHHGDHWIRALSLNPDTARRFAGYFGSLFGDKGLLPITERELIAVVVSRENGCGLCAIHHTNALGEVGGDAVRAQRISLDHHLVALSVRERALVELATKITRSPKDITRADLDHLRKAGLSEPEILEAIETSSWFNHTNRIFISLGVIPDAKYFTP